MEIKTCLTCILDNQDDKDIAFDENGVCHYCRSYEVQMKQIGTLEEREKELLKMISKIKAAGKGKKYDCLLGVSGGVDSSYMAYLAKKYDLRPLIIHLDNGWNSDTAVSNIERICTSLGFELHTYVIDWEEFVGMQKAYIRAGVVDVEVLTDHAIKAITQKLSKKYGVKYSLSGFNLVTEAIMPKGWTYSKKDYLNIKDIVLKFGEGIKIKSFPRITFYKGLINYWWYKLESFHILNYLPYNKVEAKELLKKEFDWVDYGGKHYESIFTKFYQAYILPTKFGIDKRKAHLSNLICSGQITREKALEELKKPLYDDPNEFAFEKEYVLKKLNWSEKYFDELMKQTPREHEDFDSDKRLWDNYFKFVQLLKFWR